MPFYRATVRTKDGKNYTDAMSFEADHAMDAMKKFNAAAVESGGTLFLATKMGGVRAILFDHIVTWCVEPALTPRDENGSDENGSDDAPAS